MRFELEKGTDLADVVSKCKDICDNASYRRMLSMVYLQVTGATMTVTACNGFVLIEKPVRIYEAEEGACMVDPVSLLRVLKGVKSYVVCTLVEEGRQLECKTQEGVHRLDTFTDEKYMRTDQIWPNPKSPFTVSVNPIQAVKLFKAFSDAKRPVRLDLTFDSSDACAGIEMKDQNGSRALLLPLRPQQNGGA